MTKTKQEYMRYVLLVIVIAMGAIIIHKSMPFLSGVLGASTIYILVRKQMKRLTHQKKMKKTYAAALIVGEVLLCVLIPASLAIWLLVDKLTSFDLNIGEIMNNLHHLAHRINVETGFDIFSTDNLSKVAGFATEFAQIAIGQVGSFAMNSFVMLFVLFFMLVGSDPMEKYIHDILPFNASDKKIVITEVDKLVKANAIGVPLLAVIQGFIAMIGYIIFGAPDPVLFGFLTCFATILPLIGTALVWFPLAVFLAVNGHWASGVGLALYALLVISNIDNLVRFILQERLASTHPLITVFGVIIGLSIFGFWGVIIGPLFFAMFFLCFDIYKREYIDKPKD